MTPDPKSKSPRPFDAASDLVSEPGQLREYEIDGVQPKSAAFPRRREDVAGHLARADAEGRKVVPSGSGTKLTIGAPPERVDLLLKLELLNRIVDHDHQNLTVTAEAGARVAAVQAVLRERSQFLPLDPPFGDRATIGGILAVNSSGPRRLLFGSPRDFVLGIRAALPNGTLIKAGGKTVKNVAGFDLSKLYIGSLGTLGVLVEATFRVLPLPETACTQVFLFHDLETPCAFVAKLLGTTLSPSAVELLNPEALARCKPFTGSAKKGMWGLAVSCEGFAEAVERQARDIAAIAEGAEATISITGKEQDAFWRFVTDYLPADGSRKTPTGVRGKISLPISQVKAIAADAQRMFEEAGVRGAIVAHAASGIVYFTCPDNVLPAEKIAALRKRANKLGGWLMLETAPHAIKRRVGVWDMPPGGIEIMKRIRASFDPNHTLNPGRFLDGI
jgi:glycolate oxidase FAD binding subunit